jgi:type I restriction enzyme S subunit
MSEWKEYKLSDFIEINPKVNLKSGSKYSFVEMKDLSESQKFVLPSQFKDISGGARFQNFDTLFARITPCLQNGKICQVKGLNNSIGFGSTEFLVFRGKEGISNTDFVYYLSRYDVVRKFAEQNMIGTSGRQRVSKDAFENIELFLPDLPTQTSIAEILSSLDDKIELNNKINQELENLAQTLFKKWFIDFEFPNENGEPYKSSGGEMVDSELGEIPKGWKIDSLDNIAEFLNGLALQKFPAESDYEFLPVIKIRELRQKDTSNSDKASVNLPEKYIIEDGDVLFSWSGSLMIDFWTNGKGALNQHLFKVTSKEYPKWYYYLWTKHHLTEFIAIAESKATTMGHIQRQHLTNAKVLVPNGDIITNISLVFEPIISKIIDNRVECEELIKLRDALLPKLISGELEINEINN